jgi:RNA polymerase sigma factor (sigma-70 family)
MDLVSLIRRIKDEETNLKDRMCAFGDVVGLLQDMVFGYAYAVLGDFHSAEDASQEAFIAAWRHLPSLREPAAFPGWLRRLVRTECHRMTRKSRPTIPLDASQNVPDEEPDPHALAEKGEMRDAVLEAIASLPENERMVTTLFFINGYSQGEIAGFLETPLGTVKSRLFSAKRRLRRGLADVVADRLHDHAPSRNHVFAGKVIRMLQPYSMRTPAYRYGVEEVNGDDAWALMTACVEGDLERTKALVAKDPRLVNAQYWYQFPIHLAVREGHVEIVKFLLDSGAEPGQSRYTFSSWQKLLVIAEERGYTEIRAVLVNALRERYGYSSEFESVLLPAIVARDRQEVTDILRENPGLVRGSDALGNTALHWAVMTRQLPLIDLLLERDANLHAQRADGKTPVLLSLTGDYWYRERNLVGAAIRQREVITGYLLAKGAEYGLSVACALGDGERVEQLLRERPGSSRSLDSARMSPLRYAARSGYTAIVRRLLEDGADPNAPEESAPSGGALFAACAGNHVETAKFLLEHGADPNAGVDSCGCCLTIVEVKHPTDARVMQELLVLYGAVKPPYAMSADELKAALHNNDRRTIEHEEFMRCVIEDDDVLRVMLETRPELIARVCDEVLWSDAHPRTQETIDLAVARGFDVRQTDWLGTSFLHVCAKTGDLEAAQAFLAHGADINAVEIENGTTPLACASHAGKTEMVRFLLDAGADPNRARGGWAKPLVRALKAGHVEIADILRRYGATE